MQYRIPIEIEPPRRVFGLATPRHMLQKLYWEIHSLERNIESQVTETHSQLDAAYFAFNAAVTAWHLSDWVWESASVELKAEIANELKLKASTVDEFQRSLSQNYEAIENCRNIANGSKHKTDRGNQSFRVSLEWTYGSTFHGTTKIDAPISYDLLVVNNGHQVRAVEMFNEVFRVWRCLLSEWGFVEPELVTGDYKPLV